MKVAIIGAGLVGRILAWRLDQLDQGIKITLIDQYNRHHRGTGLIAAAMVAPYTEAVNTESITQYLGEHSHALWAHWLPELETQTAQAVSFNQQGSIVVSHTQDDASWQRFRFKAQAVIADEKMQTLDHSSLQTLEPELAQNFDKGLFFPHEGVINNQDLYPALNTYFDQAQNIDYQENTKINLNDSAVIGKLDECGENSNNAFDYVFDCRGNDAKAQLSQLRSVRGEVASVYAPEVNLTRAIRLIHPRYPLYIAPRENHHYIIGATQLESDDDSPVTVRSGLELLSALYSLHQGFGEAHIIDLMTGLRPSFPNNLPQISINGKLISINGLFRHGYLFSPILVNDLIEQLFGDVNKVSFPKFIQQDNSSQSITENRHSVV